MAALVTSAGLLIAVLSDGPAPSQRTHSARPRADQWIKAYNQYTVRMNAAIDAGIEPGGNGFDEELNPDHDPILQQSLDAIAGTRKWCNAVAAAVDEQSELLPSPSHELDAALSRWIDAMAAYWSACPLLDRDRSNSDALSADVARAESSVSRLIGELGYE